MKTMKFLTMLFACTALMLSVQAKDAKKDKKTAQVTYAVNIHCNDCKQKIEDKIPFEKGVKDLKVDMDAKQVTVTFDPKKTDKEAVKKAFQKLEFQVKEKPACCAVK